MKKKTRKETTDPDARIAELVRTLREAEAELQALTGGQLDAVVSEGNTPYLLRDAQEKLRVSEAAQRALAETQMSILNALPAHIALLDSQGVIIAVNEAWQRFASANVLQSSDFFVGHNYLGICESAHGECADEAQAVATGIRKVLSSEAKDFAIEYPCHSPSEQRWFRLMVTPLSETQRTGVVVMHVNVTQRRAAEEILREKEREQRRLAEELTLETHRLHESQAVANVGSWEMDLATLEVTWTDETFRIFETRPEEFKVTHEGFLERIHPEDRRKVDDAFKRTIGQAGQFAIEHRLLFPDGRIKFLEERWHAFMDAMGRPVRAVGTCQDITQRKMAEDLIRIRARQQETIAKIGFEATRATTLEGIFNFAIGAVAEALEVELCKVLQLVPDGSHLRLVSGVGWQAGLIGVGTVGVDREFQAGFTLNADGPIYVNDFSKETRFKAPPLLRQHEVVSGLSVKILLRDKPWGVLGAHCRTVRNFNEADADFMQAVATLLAVVIERLAVQHSLTASEARMRDAQRIAHLGNWEVDLANNEVNWSEESFRIFGAEPENFSPSYAAFLALVHPDDLAAMRTAHENAVSGKGPLEIEHRIIRGDGAVRFVRERGELIHDENGLPIALSGTVLDITDLRAAQSRAERMNALLTEAQRIADMGSWEMDLATGRLVWSDETCRLFGIQPGEFGGTFEAFTEFILPEDRASYGEIHAKITPAAPLLEAEYRIRRPDGTVRWMFVRGMVTFDSAGKVTRRLGVVMDITERKHAEAKVHEAAQFANLRAEIANQLTAPLALPGITRGVCELLVRHLGMAFARIWTLDEAEQVLMLQASAGLYTHLDGPHARVPMGQFKIGRIAQNRKPHLTNDVSHDTEISDPAWAEREGMVAFAGYPLMIEGRVLGVLGMFSRHAFSEQVFGELPALVDWIAQFIQRKRDEAALSVSGKQLRLLETCVSRLNDIVLITEAEPIDDPGPRILYVNDAFVRRTGFTREEAIGKTPRLLQGPKTQRDALDRIRAALKAWKPVREELINYTKSGEEFWLELDIVPVADATGWFTHWVAIERDITERKIEEEKLRESEARVRAVIDSSLNAVVVMDAAGKFLDWNQRAEKIFGWSHAEAVGRDLAETIIPPRFHEAHRRGMKHYLASGEGPVLNRLLEMSAMRRNGDEFPVEMSIASMKTGDRVTFCGFIADITERKRVQEALAETQRQYRDLVETSHNVIWTVDLEGRFTFLNQASRAIFGRAPEEMIGHHFHEFVPEDQHQANDEIFARMLREGQDVIDYSNRIRRKDGSIAILNSNARLVLDAQGQRTGISGMSQDTTESVRAQEAIAQSEARFRGLFDQAAVGMCLVSTEGDFLRTNARFCEIVGYSAAELLQRDCVATTHPDEREMEAKIVARILAGELESEAWEKRYIHKAGHAVWCNLTLSLLPGGSGQPPQFVAVVEDITERRSAVEQLRHREQLLRIAGKVARMGGWSVDFPEVRITWSDEVCTIHDMPAGTVPALDQALGFYTPESRPVIESALSLCASEGTPFDVEAEVLTAKGRRAWIRSSGQADRDKTGAIRRVQGAFQDITEQKTVESEALRAAETLAGIVQIQQEITSANLPLPTVMQMMAERAQVLTGATGGVVEFAEGDDMVYAVGSGVVADKIGLRLKRVGSLSGLAFATGEVLCCDDTETDPRVDLPSCRTVGVRSMIVAPLSVGEEIVGVLKVLSGKPRAFTKRDVNNLQILVETLGVVIQRQRAAEALRGSMEEFRTLAEAMPQIVWVTRADGWTTYFNRHWMDYTGLTLEESLGHGWNKPFHPEDQQRAWDAWQLATATVGTYTLECRLMRADGEYRWWLIRGEPQKDAAGNVLKWFGTCTDIHDLKEAEQNIHQLNSGLEQRVIERTAQLEAANQELEAFSYSVSHDLRAPLRGVNGFIRMLREDYADKLDTEGNRLIDVVSSEAIRMGQLIDDLLEFSRLGRQSMRRQAVDMTELAQGVFENLTRSAPESAPRVKFTPLPETSGDRAMLRQVFVNLIGNAIKFTRHQPAPEIEIGGGELDGQQLYYVKDNGAGFDEKYSEKLFGVFQRLHSDTEFEGTGVGLALVQRVIHRHGGKVWAKGKPGAGAEFYFSLPTRKETAYEHTN